MPKYVRRIPAVVDAVQFTADMYDGYVNVCAHHLDSLIFIDERLVEDKYRDSDFCCEHEDDGHCMEFGSPCEHLRKIGYIRAGDRWLYPYVGDYMIKDGAGNISFMPSEQFEATFKLADCRSVFKPK